MIYLGEPHIKTLTKLQAIAEKYNSSISITVEPISDNDVDFDIIVEQGDMTETVKNDIQENLWIKECRTNGYKYTFELIDRRNVKATKYNTLTYFSIDTSFKYDEYGIDDLLIESQEWLSDNDDYGDGYIYYSTTDQKIDGWEGVDTSFVNVYREGMLLKFFGDLVCEYFGEEKIQEVY